MTMPPARSLEEQRLEFSRSQFLIPAIIVVIYLITIFVLARRPRS